MADYYIYDLMRRFARATRAMSVYDCYSCLMELEHMPSAHQQSSWVLSMVGRAHYERLEYASVRNLVAAFLPMGLIWLIRYHDLRASLG